jgi:parallel beta-helix repeat protein
MRKLRFSGGALLAAALVVIGLTACEPNPPLVVDDDGLAGNNGNCNGTDPTSDTIQEAVDAASPGAVIRVCPGVYEDNVDVNKANVIILGPKNGQNGTRAVTEATEAIIRTDSGGVGGKMRLTAHGVAVDGFLFEDVEDDAALATAATASGYHIRSNIFRSSVFGLYLNSNGSQQTLVEKNLFGDNNDPGAANGNGIYSDQGLSSALIRNNAFNENLNAGILLTEANTVTRNVVIKGNTSEDDTTFVNLFNVSSVEIRGNTTNDTDDDNDTEQGCAIRAESSDGVFVRGNTIQNAPFSGICVREGTFNMRIRDNTVTGSEAAGIDVRTDVPGGATVFENTTNNNVERGIHLQAGTSENRIETNTATGNGTDCDDDTTGTNRAGVANLWDTDNDGGTSTPAGLCPA